MKSPRLQGRRPSSRGALFGAALALVAVAMTACTSHAGAAAQVDDQTIDTATVSAIADRGMEAYTAYAAAHPDVVAQRESQQGPITRDLVQRRALNSLIRVRLDEAKARELGITLTPQDFDAYYQALAVTQAGSVPAFEDAVGVLGFAPQDVRTQVHVDALESKIADKVAPDLVGTDAQAKSAYDGLLAQFGVKSLPLSYEQLRPFLARDIVEGTARSDKVTPELVKLSRQVGVSVSPRFGAWSVDDLQVLPQSGSIATTATPDQQLSLS
ncbi:MULTISPECIES: SurA N-terminal domain-containing protein [Pseudofrankia]|uniref:SurA N-terminal domain-containing protein n=1 Tax=Pseudofrankia TaxID=2994363 RepID=UPI001E463545|nr:MULTISPECIES: SurA N-terminal domain-containing protein [Pseudofrankia]